MSPTTKAGNIAKWTALAAALSTVVGQSLPEASGYANLATLLALAVGQWANGQGNVQSKTGGPNE